ncbi:MAG: hypothetical protein ACD_63C00146G0001 [uncultured bacterium]|nr:MAG: hypothetical protein ACD_63C00146G0001 [uncultured bacterium]
MPIHRKGESNEAAKISRIINMTPTALAIIPMTIPAIAMPLPLRFGSALHFFFPITPKMNATIPSMNPNTGTDKIKEKIPIISAAILVPSVFPAVTGG